MVLTALLAGSVVLAAAAPASVTFNKEVLPILQKHCQVCHRPGEVAPMSFVTYQETRPWAKAIKEAVVTRKMPPWFADPAYGHFRNARTLKQAEMNALIAWADSGAAEGDARHKPGPVEFASGWSIGKPDIVIEMPKDIPVQAQGQMDQANVLVRVNFAKDLWVKAAEVRPGNPKVVHHMKAWVRFPASEWMKDAPEGELYKPQRAGSASRSAPGTQGARPMFGEGLSQDMLAKFNPGVNAQEFAAGEAAKFIPAGSDIVFECHYVPSGAPQTDRSRVGIVLASAPPKKRY
ncbi:MAG: thiol-disulfide isomerase, partial [Bryobacteraceae bacterium]